MTTYQIIVTPPDQIVAQTDPVIVTQQAVEFVAGPPGIRGSSNLMSAFNSVGALSGHRAVAAVSGGVSYADPNTPAAVVGITTGASANNAPSEVQYFGSMTEPSWNWALNVPIFCGANGVLTQTAPTSGTQLIVAMPTSATAININIQQPITLA